MRFEGNGSASTAVAIPRRKWISLIAISAALAAQTSHGASVNARFEPSEIGVDGRAQLIVDAVGSGRAEETAPFAVDGLTLRRMPTVYSVKPDGTVSTTISHGVTAQRVGIYALSSAALRVGEEFIPVPNVQLTVLSATDAAFKGGRLTDRLRQMQLCVEGLPNKIYVGQTFPIEIVLPVPPAVRVRLRGDPPAKIGGGFRIGASGDVPLDRFVMLNQPASGEARWRTLLTATSSGSYALAFAIGFDASDSDNLLAESSLARSLGNMFAVERWSPLAVYSTRNCGVVLPLPEIDRPEKFSGAIGTFKIGEIRLRDLSESTVELRISIDGRGNFGQLSAPELEAIGCKILRKSRSLFSPNDRLGFGGSVEFRYVVSVEKDGRLPKFSFCFFNPESSSYEWIQCDPAEDVRR